MSPLAGNHSNGKQAFGDTDLGVHGIDGIDADPGLELLRHPRNASKDLPGRRPDLGDSSHPLLALLAPEVEKLIKSEIGSSQEVGKSITPQTIIESLKLKLAPGAEPGSLLQLISCLRGSAYISNFEDPDEGLKKILAADSARKYSLLTKIDTLFNRSLIVGGLFSSLDQLRELVNFPSYPNQDSSPNSMFYKSYDSAGPRPLTHAKDAVASRVKLPLDELLIVNVDLQGFTRFIKLHPSLHQIGLDIGGQVALYLEALCKDFSFEMVVQPEGDARIMVLHIPDKNMRKHFMKHLVPQAMMAAYMSSLETLKNLQIPELVEILQENQHALPIRNYCVMGELLKTKNESYISAQLNVAGGCDISIFSKHIGTLMELARAVCDQKIKLSPDCEDQLVVITQEQMDAALKNPAYVQELEQLHRFAIEYNYQPSRSVSTNSSEEQLEVSVPFFSSGDDTSLGYFNTTDRQQSFRLDRSIETDGFSCGQAVPLDLPYNKIIPFGYRNVRAVGLDVISVTFSIISPPRNQSYFSNTDEDLTIVFSEKLLEKLEKIAGVPITAVFTAGTWRLIFVRQQDEDENVNAICTTTLMNRLVNAIDLETEHADAIVSRGVMRYQPLHEEGKDPRICQYMLSPNGDEILQVVVTKVGPVATADETKLQRKGLEESRDFQKRLAQDRLQILRGMESDLLRGYLEEVWELPLSAKQRPEIIYLLGMTENTS